MAKVTITIKDRRDGTVTVTADFEPTIKRGKDGEAKVTSAQYAAVTAIEAIRSLIQDEGN